MMSDMTHEEQQAYLELYQAAQAWVGIYDATRASDTVRSAFTRLADAVVELDDLA